MRIPCVNKVLIIIIIFEGEGWANTKKKFAHRKIQKKNIVHNKPIEKKNRARTRGKF